MNEDFLQGLTGRIVTPLDPAYNTDRQGYNHGVQNFPLIINYCSSAEDVSNAVRWSTARQVPLRVRSGGHNYEGYSNGNCVLVIDISEMNAIALEEERSRVRVQGGVTNGQLYNYISALDYPFPGGTCPTVGLSGYATGGGWGLSCRRYGLGCDNLLEIELVNYQGDILTANPSCKSDLFWACLGAGGGNFGVITSMLFKLPAPVSNVTLIEIDYLHVSLGEPEEFLSVWQDWLETADNRISLLSRIYQSEEDGLAMLVRGIFYGEPEEASKILAPFLTLPNAVSSILYVTFLEAVTILGSSYPPFEKFDAVSRFALRKYSSSEIATLVNLISNPSEGSVFTGLSLYTLGGKVSETGSHDTAFFYRNARYILWLETVWEEDRYACPNMNWIACRFPVFASLTTGSYVNFPYYGLPQYLREYYGDNAKRLEAVKREYDPYNIFTFPQGLQQSNCSFGPSPHPDVEYSDDAYSAATGNHRNFRYVNN